MHTAASLFKEMCYRYREDLMAGILVAGWDPRRGGQVRSWSSQLWEASLPYSELTAAGVSCAQCSPIAPSRSQVEP